MQNFLGIEIGGTKLQVVLGDNQARILQRVRFPVDAARGAAGIRSDIDSALASFGGRSLKGVGIGFGGPVDRESGKVLASYQVQGWKDFSLRDWLRERTGVPVWIDNDANVAALAEATHGAGKSLTKVFYVTLGSGVGAGFVENGAIYHGARSAEAEFGHIRLEKSGRTVESSCSGWAVDEKIRKHLRERAGGVLAETARSYAGNEARAMTDALQRYDPDARRILDETTDDLSFGLSHVVHLLNPDVIVLGGGLSLIGDPLRRAVEEKLPRYLMDVLRPGPTIRISELREDVVTIGALTLSTNNHP